MPSLLIVDRSEEQAKLAKQRLLALTESHDLHIQTVSHSVEAETLLTMAHFSIIIWDAMMALTHHDSIEHLLASHKGAEKSSVIFSAYEQDLMKHTHLIHNKNVLVLKPFQEEDLQWQVKKILATLIPVESDPTEKMISLSESEKQKTELLQKIKQNLNHELQNPLTSILIGAQALGRRVDGSPSEQQIIKEVEHSARRIKEILDHLEYLPNRSIQDVLEEVEMVTFSDQKPIRLSTN